MILQALYDYYQRKRDDLPAEGLERKEIHFLIVLTPDGGFLHIEDTREGEGKEKHGKSFLVPQAVKKSSNVAANLLWGNLEYVLGEANTKKLAKKQAKDAKKEAEYRQRLLEMHSAFKDRIQSLAESVRNTLRPVIAFLDRRDFSPLYADPLWPEIRAGANLSFKIAGEESPVCSLPEVLGSVGVRAEDIAGEGVCLITGETDAIRRIHPPIKGVNGDQKFGSNIVSFNRNAFRSFGRTQGENAPVGVRAAFAYTTALNHLLASEQCIHVGDTAAVFTTMVFWAERTHHLENWLPQLFGDNPDQGTQALKALYAMPLTGATAVEESQTKFFVLGLAALSEARLTVRFWRVATVGELAGHIRQHFKDLEIVRPQYVTNYFLSMKTLLSAIAPYPDKRRKNDDKHDLRPKLADDFMHAILHGLPYPQPLLQAALTRIRAEQAKKRDNGKPAEHVTYARAALIKAWLNRYERNRNKPEKEIGMTLDESCTNIGYRLGRLFAVLEHIQQDANPGTNTTLRDSYFGSAMSTPGAVFPTIMRRNQHHMAKLRKEKPGLAVNHDKLMQAILNEGVDCTLGFPATLSLPDQGRFVIGYYQQRQALYKKSQTKPETSEERSVQ
jgi:CRISPR-associated protein Csd1